MSVGLAFPTAFPLGLHTEAFPCASHGFSVCTHPWRLYLFLGNQSSWNRTYPADSIVLVDLSRETEQESRGEIIGIGSWLRRPEIPTILSTSRRTRKASGMILLSSKVWESRGWWSESENQECQCPRSGEDEQKVNSPLLHLLILFRPSVNWIMRTPTAEGICFTEFTNSDASLL